MLPEKSRPTLRKILVLCPVEFSRNPGTDSDLDIAIIKDLSLPAYKRSIEKRKHLRGLKFPIDLFVFTKEELHLWGKVRSSLIHDIIETGKLFYG